MRDKHICYGALTAKKGADGGVLDAGERLVDGEHVGDVLRALRLEIVGAEAADESRIAMSSCAHSRPKRAN